MALADEGGPRSGPALTTTGALEALSGRLDALQIRPVGPFARPEILEQALTHSSFVAEHGGVSNERLEMLGDAVLGFVVTEMLFELYPDAQEGALTRLRASLVDEVSLAKQARALDLGPLLRMGRGESQSGGRGRDAALADAFEAVVAALYLSEGTGVVRTVTDQLFRPQAAAAGPDAAQSDDYKTLLQLRSQGLWKTQPAYRIAKATGPDHEREFTAVVLIGTREVGTGSGRSKKLAEQQAARAALSRWEEIIRERGGAGSV